MVRGAPLPWKTRGIHVGTGRGRVKHGIDDLKIILGSVP
jgi:hypothetical protein